MPLFGCVSYANVVSDRSDCRDDFQACTSVVPDNIWSDRVCTNPLNGNAALPLLG
jgi:hypothetical protein